MSGPSVIDYGIDEVVKVDGIEYDVKGVWTHNGGVRFDAVRILGPDGWRPVGPNLKHALSDDVMGEIAGHWSDKDWDT